MADFGELETWWPMAATNLRRRLRAMRVHRDEIDDVVQRTALKATLKSLDAPFENESHLVAWAVVVGRNFVISDGRRATRARAANHLATRPEQDDVEDEVIAYLKRDSLQELIEGLPERKRAALAFEDFGELAIAKRNAVTRHRTKHQLRKAFDRLGVAIGSWQARVRFRQVDGATAAGQAALAALAIATLAVGPVHLGQGSHRSNVKRARVAMSSPRTAEPGGADKASLIEWAAPTRSDAPSKANGSGSIRIGLGADQAGNERWADTHRGSESEEGVLVCQGPPDAPDSECLYWPAMLHASIESVVGLVTP